MTVNDQLLLWNHASLRVLDVRHALLTTGEALVSYRLPASVFLFPTRGNAQVLLDGTKHTVKRFQVLHSGKGATMDIHMPATEFEYYLIYYKAALPPLSRQELVGLMERSSPFQLQYSFLPDNPLVLFHIVREMEQEWRQAGSLEHFQVKSLFYQFVHKILQQMHRQGIELQEPDLALQAIGYIEGHYAEPITLESLADALNYSVPHLSALFKKRTGYSLIDYLIRKRIDTAAILLKETEASVQEIAASVGYKDSYYFGRLFKKNTGVSPARYRAIALAKAEDNPSDLIESSIASNRLWRYIDDDNHYHHKREVKIQMLRHSKSTAAATLLLCFALLLSACSGGATSSGANTGGNQSQVTSTASTPAPSTPPTKVITTINGEIEIPQAPTRIVADQYLGSFIALGVPPIGAPGLHRKNPYIADALQSVEDIGDVNGSLEKVVDLQPDLIVTGEQSRYEALSKIAPTITIPYGDLKNAHEELTYFGKLLGKEKEAEAWLADYDRRIAEAKDKVRKAIPAEFTFSIFETADKSTYVYGDNFGRGGQAIYQALGFQPPAAVAKEIFEKQWAELSSELLPKYAGDYIILTSNDKTLEDIKADPIWSTLEAVKNNHVYIWKEERSWYYDPIAVLSQTEELAAWLTGQK